MVNILIFRTDRIGDLIVSCPAIITIKEYFKVSNITLITSDNNYDYAKSLNIFNQIYKFPKKNILDKISLIKKLRKNKFDYIYILDGKERSIISSIFINSKIKISLTQKIKNLYKISKIKFFLDNEKTNLNEIFQKMLNYSNIDTKIGSYDFLTRKKDNNFSLKIPISKYVHIHLDEKWFNELYINSYTNINPKYDDFVQFIDNVSEKDNLVITTGLVDIKLVDQLKNNFLKRIDDKIFYKRKNKTSIYLIFKPTFYEIESLLRKTSTLIACHGSVLHAANSFKITKIDILEKKMNDFYQRFTSHIKNYHPIYRNNFSNLSKEIFNLL